MPTKAPSLVVHAAAGYLKMVRTRMPFRYGSACLVESPHLYLTLDISVDGARVQGVAAENLPPLWFDKNPAKDYPQQIREQLQVVRWACDAVTGHRGSGFSLWKDAHDHAHQLGADAGFPALLAGFGATMVERCLWDAVGRATGRSFAALVRANAMGVDLAALDPGVAGIPLRGILPDTPLPSIWARHTVGLADPISDSEIPAHERVNDGLPQSLDACLRTYGYRYLKIKLANDLPTDIDRLIRIARAIDAYEAGSQGARVLCTLDGNENYNQVAELAALAAALGHRPELQTLGKRILCIEQPLNRAVALDSERLAGISDLAASFPLIIDESDATLDTYPRAWELGYRGTTHKNCKGIIKTLLNLARNRRYEELTGEQAILTGEDLTNIGPIALLQDLAVVATLGISHVERNGHHYFRGLDHLTHAEARALAAAHPGLYRTEGDLIALDVQSGKIDCRSLQQPGLGTSHQPSTAGWTDWDAFDAVRALA